MDEELQKAIDELKRHNKAIAKQLMALEVSHVFGQFSKGHPNPHPPTCECGGRIEQWRNGATKEGERPPTIKCVRCTQEYKLVEVGKKVEIHSGIREDV